MDEVPALERKDEDPAAVVSEGIAEMNMDAIIEGAEGKAPTLDGEAAEGETPMEREGRESEEDDEGAAPQASPKVARAKAGAEDHSANEAMAMQADLSDEQLEKLMANADASAGVPQTRAAAASRRFL